MGFNSQLRWRRATVGGVFHGSGLWFCNRGGSLPPPAAVPALAARWRPRRGHRLAAAGSAPRKTIHSLFPLRRVLLLRRFQRPRPVLLLLIASALQPEENHCLKLYHEFLFLTWNHYLLSHNRPEKSPNLLSWTFATPCAAAYQSLSCALLRRGRLWHPLPWAVITSSSHLGFSHLFYLRSLS